MTNSQAATLQDVFDHIQKVYKQSKLMTKDTIDALRERTRCHFVHRRDWDYATKPNEHFLDGDLFGVSQAWVTYVPEGKLNLAALFYFEFYSSRHFVVPSLMYGSLDPGGNGFDDINRWASYNTTFEAVKGKSEFKVQHDGSLNIVTTSMEKHFTEARLVKVPLESIRNSDDLQRIVVEPLAALIQGQYKESNNLLEKVETMPWPIITPYDDDSNEEAEEI